MKLLYHSFYMLFPLSGIPGLFPLYLAKFCSFSKHPSLALWTQVNVYSVLLSLALALVLIRYTGLIMFSSLSSFLVCKFFEGRHLMSFTLVLPTNSLVHSKYCVMMLNRHISIQMSQNKTITYNFSGEKEYR